MLMFQHVINVKIINEILFYFYTSLLNLVSILYLQYILFWPSHISSAQ